MNEKNKITKITIAGRPASGKSTLAELIAGQLSLMGIEVEMKDEVGPGVPDNKQGSVVRSMNMRMRALRNVGKVKIETRQIYRKEQDEEVQNV